MRTIQDKITVALENIERYQVDTTSEQYIEMSKKICLSESSHILTEGLISELTARDVVTRMAMLAQREQRGLKAADLQNVISASLRGENFENGDESAIDQETQSLMANEGVVQSIQHELKKLGIGFYY